MVILPQSGGGGGGGGGGVNGYFGVFLENWACAKSYQIFFLSEKVCQKKTYLSNFLLFRFF